MTLLPSHTALDAPSLVFLMRSVPGAPPTGTLRVSKSCAIIASIGEICGLSSVMVFTGTGNSHRERPIRTKQDFILTEHLFCQLN